MEAERREEDRQFQEQFRQEMRQVSRDEDEEEREIGESYLRLEYMQENCTENDWEIQGLLDEQRALLGILRMRKREFADSRKKEIHRF